MPFFADKVISFFADLQFTGNLPAGVSIMNPFTGNGEITDIISEFYRKYYSDNRLRHMIIGINPGRSGAGTTGIPFTDTVRLKEKLGIVFRGPKTYEPSSVFIYEMIGKYGGPGKFYKDFLVTSVSPLGFTKTGPQGREINYNYYDSRELTEAIKMFAVDSLKKQLEFGIERDVCFCLGTGKNFRFIEKLNDEYKFFGRVEPLDHPRFIMQYRAKRKEAYLELYVKMLRSVTQK
jgi:hypothetical protein